jgi:hypothetical protein
LQTQLNIVPKVIRRMWIKDFMFYMLRDCFGNLMAKNALWYFMLLMTIHK